MIVMKSDDNDDDYYHDNNNAMVKIKHQNNASKILYIEGKKRIACKHRHIWLSFLSDRGKEYDGKY